MATGAKKGDFIFMETMDNQPTDTTNTAKETSDTNKTVETAEAVASAVYATNLTPEEEAQLHGWRRIVTKIGRFYERIPLLRWLVHKMFILDGRINRWPYFCRCLVSCLINTFVYFIVMIPLGLLGVAIFRTGSSAAAAFALQLLFFVIYMVVDLPGCIGGILLLRARMHDIGLSLWWAIAAFLTPFLGLACMVASPSTSSSIIYAICFVPMLTLLLAVCFWPGKRQDNKYGPSPLPATNGWTV